MWHEFIAIVLVLNSFIILEGILAYRGKLFRPKQMIKDGNQVGITWIMHFGASWGDFFIISPLTAIFYIRYNQQWSLCPHVLLITIVIAITVVAHIIWSKSSLPDCLAWGNKINPAGYVHMLYMCIVLTVIVLFYFETNHTDKQLLIWSSVLIGFHLALGNHLIPSLFKPSWWPKDTFFTIQTLPVVLGIWLALFFRCWYVLKHQ